MVWQYSPYLFPLLVAVGISLAVAGVAWHYRDYPGARPLALLMLATAWWSLTYLLALATTDFELKLLIYKLMYPAIVVVPVAWLVFAIDYTGRIRSPTRRELGGLLVIPVVTVLFAWTNGTHGLIWASIDLVSRGSLIVLTNTKGIGFWVFAAYTYLLLAIGTGLILQMVLLSEHVYRGQGIALGAAVLIPWGANALYLTGVTGVWDPTNLGFALGGGILMGAIFRRQLLQLVPVAREVARDEFIDSMAEAVIVIDEHEQIADLNPAAEDLIDRGPGEAIGAQITAAFPAVADVIDHHSESRERAEITITDDGQDRYYEVQTVPLRRGYGTITGQLLTLRDVTTRYERERRLRRQRQRLEVLNRVLRHDIRNGMNVIFGHADQVSTEHGDTDQAVQVIKDKSMEIVDLSESARQFESVISGNELEYEVIDVVDVIERITGSLASEYPAADIRTDLPEEAPMVGTELTGFALRNLIKNAIEHNDTAHPWVEVSAPNAEAVSVRIADNGPGLPSQERAVIEKGQETPLEHSSGLGLWLATWAIRDSGGEIAITDNEPRGTVITLRFREGGSNAHLAG